MNRRELLKHFGRLGIATPFMHIWGATANPGVSSEFVPLNARAPAPEQPVSLLVAGAGERGNAYAAYSERHPDEIQVVGVAEPNIVRRRRFSDRYRIPAHRQWNSWEEMLQGVRLADSVAITTPDHLHTGPALAAIRAGYALLLEKPIAQSWHECKEILSAARDHNALVAVCHVLRYSPYFRKLKEIVDSKVIGDIVSVQHFEPVEHTHMAHAFVRGNWRNSRESNFMLLSKSCHDLDLLRWILGRRCERLSSFGGLHHFRVERAPPGSTDRCTSGCLVESTCPYSALKIYYRDRNWLGHFDLPRDVDQGPAILDNLKTGPYGRCVYRCDNDVVDHQVVSMEFEGNITVAFSMEAFTSYGGRRTRIMGTMGDVVGDEQTLSTCDFRTGTRELWDATSAAGTAGHNGGDDGLMADFVQAVSKRDSSLLSSTIQASMESHLIAFSGEQSRLEKRVVELPRI